jgi:hypothetical protein
MARKGRLTANRVRALEALLSEPTIRAAAKSAHLGERTLYRYLGDADFRAELRKRQQQVLAAVTGVLVGQSGSVVGVLGSILADKGASDSVKARVALGWLSQMYQSAEFDNLLERIEHLEVLVNEQREQEA